MTSQRATLLVLAHVVAVLTELAERGQRGFIILLYLSTCSLKIRSTANLISIDVYCLAYSLIFLHVTHKCECRGIMGLVQAKIARAGCIGNTAFPSRHFHTVRPHVQSEACVRWWPLITRDAISLRKAFRFLSGLRISSRALLFHGTLSCVGGGETTTTTSALVEQPKKKPTRDLKKNIRCRCCLTVHGNVL